MDWRDIAAFVSAFILLVAVFVKANIEARKEIKTMEIMDKILKEKDEYKKMNEKLKKKIKDLQNKNKN